MEIIDGKWILARLSPRHGAKAEFADAIGLDRDKLTKVLNGNRKLTPKEIAKVVRYFDQGAADPATHQSAESLDARAARLSPDRRSRYLAFLADLEAAEEADRERQSPSTAAPD